MQNNNITITEQAKFIYDLEKNGFFVDVGAYDGITGSNTYMLEFMGWNGVCIEPNKEPFKLLDIHRKCEKHNIAISNCDGELEFIAITGYAEQISCVKSTAPSEHINRITTEINTHGGNVTKNIVSCRKFSSLIKQKDITYLSIDAESHELSILEGIDFSYHNIKYISFEKNPYDNNDCGKFLENYKYKHLKTIGIDNFYIKND